MMSFHYLSFWLTRVSAKSARGLLARRPSHARSVLILENAKTRPFTLKLANNRRGRTVTVGTPAGQHFVCDVFRKQTPCHRSSRGRQSAFLRAENEEIRKRLDTLAMHQVLRNSDKGNL